MRRGDAERVVSWTSLPSTAMTSIVIERWLEFLLAASIAVKTARGTPVSSGQPNTLKREWQLRLIIVRQMQTFPEGVSNSTRSKKRAATLACALCMQRTSQSSGSPVPLPGEDCKTSP